MVKITNTEEKEEEAKQMQAKLLGTILSYLLTTQRNKKRGSVKQKLDQVFSFAIDVEEQQKQFDQEKEGLESQVHDYINIDQINELREQIEAAEEKEEEPPPPPPPPQVQPPPQPPPSPPKPAAPAYEYKNN